MASTLSRVQPVRNPVLPAQTTPEQRYWRGFGSSLLIKEYNAIDHIHFNPVAPHDIAITSSTRIQIISAKTRQVAKTISRFKDTVYSGEFSANGKLLVAGDATGLVQIFDSNSRSLLVTLSPTTHPTHVTKFNPVNSTNLLTASDDRIARLYDISESKPIATFADHTDYIRSACFIPGSNLFATGCYDGIVRVYDPRVSPSESHGPVIQFSHDSDPVEDVLALNPTTLVSAGGPAVKVWNMASGKQVQHLGNFQKAVTCLVDAGDKGLLAGSLDGHVKVFDSLAARWDVKFGWKFGGGVLSCGISPNNKHLVVGLVSGLLAIRTRKTEPRVAQGVKQAKSTSFARMMRGGDYKAVGEAENVTIVNDNQPREKTKKLRLFEKHLNAFRWSEALDVAFASGMKEELTVTVLEELKRRGKVRVSLLNRDETSLEPLLQWCVGHIDDVRCVSIIADWVSVVIDMYGGLIDRSPVLEELIYSLSKRVNREIEKAQTAQEIRGMLVLLAT